MEMEHLRRICTLLLLASLSAGLALSQAVSATLLGSITDSTGGTVPAAQVVVTETNTGISRSAKTGTAGNYVFADLPPGTYSVSVELTGFRKAVRAGVDLLVNSSTRVDLTLTPGNVTEVINVTSEVPILQTDRSDIGVKVEETQLANLPVSTPGGRNFQALLNFVPGTTRAFRPHSEFFNPQNSLSTQVNGQSRLSNNLQFEGVDNNHRTGLLQVLIPPIESLQTVDISTSNFEAELGRATGAVTNISMKSGTNQFHAQGYWFNRVSALAARPFYDPVRSHSVYNYFGGQLGGPIIKNRTFFFVDYLKQTDHRYSVDRYTLPTDRQRRGDLSEYPAIVYDPASGNPNGTNRIPFPGNKIDASRIQTVPNKILGLVPLPNLTGLTNNFFTLIPFVRDTPQYDVKGDHNQTQNDRISVRYSNSTPTTFDGSSFGIAGGPHGGGFQGRGVQSTHNGALGYTRIFSPTLIGELRFGVSRYRNDAQQLDYGTSASTALGVPGVNTNDPFVSGLVGISVGGYSSPLVGYSASLPWVRAETNIDLVNTWTKTLSNHTVKWGGDIRRVRDDLRQTQSFSPRGAFAYGSSTTSLNSPGVSIATGPGNNFASFLLDQPNSVGRDFLIATPTYRAWNFFLFAQDKWQVTRKLTVDFGLRWEFYPPALPASPVGGFSNYDPTNNSLVVGGVGNNPANLGLDTHHKNFAPRIGIAYRLNEKTVFRAGFGISYTPFPDNTYAFNFPVKQNNAYSPANSYGPSILPNGQAATLAAGFPAPTQAVIPAYGIIQNADVNQSYEVINKHFREPYVESWNLALQRALPFKFSLDVAYVANHGVAQPAAYNLNAATVLGLDIAGQPLYQLFKRSASTTLRYVGFGSSYNSMQVKFNRRFSGGLLITTSYTYGKAEGFQSEDGGLRFYIDQRRNWERLDFDRKHNFVLGYVWELPFGKGKLFMNSNPVAAVILGGWHLNGSVDVQSGSPLNFGGNTAPLRAPGNANTLDFFGSGIEVTKGNGRNASWFTPNRCSGSVTSTSNCFAQPTAFGNLGPNVISGPGSWNMSLAVARTFNISERLKLELRGEGFSVANTPQWNNPDTGIGNPTFGFITGAGGNRTVQIGTKIVF